MEGLSKFITILPGGGGLCKFIKILHGGGLPDLLQYYKGGGSLRTPNLYYVIYGRPPISSAQSPEGNGVNGQVMALQLHCLRAGHTSLTKSMFP